MERNSEAAWRKISPMVSIWVEEKRRGGRKSDERSFVQCKDERLTVGNCSL